MIRFDVSSTCDRLVCSIFFFEGDFTHLKYYNMDIVKKPFLSDIILILCLCHLWRKKKPFNFHLWRKKKPFNFEIGKAIHIYQLTLLMFPV